LLGGDFDKKSYRVPATMNAFVCTQFISFLRFVELEGGMSEIQILKLNEEKMRKPEDLELPYSAENIPLLTISNETKVMNRVG
jgi:hypothetical protein